MDYKKDITISHDGVTSFCLYTITKKKIAIGYNRIVFGQRGPYIEFTKEQVLKESMHIPKNESWKLLKKYADKIDYIELRTNKDNIKVYFQKKLVDYADYKPGFIYISPFDLYNEAGDVIIKINNKPLRKKAPMKEEPKSIKITKNDRDVSYDKIHEYLTERFNDIKQIKKSDFLYYKEKNTLFGTKIKQWDTLFNVCIIHTDNLKSKDSYITVHFKLITLRELDMICKKYYLVKKRREPVFVEIEYMFDEPSRKKINDEYN